MTSYNLLFVFLDHPVCFCERMIVIKYIHFYSPQLGYKLKDSAKCTIHNSDNTVKMCLHLSVSS